jgi:hypothetical protein
MIIVKKNHSAKWHILDARQKTLCKKAVLVIYSVEIDEIPENDTSVCKGCKGALVKERVVLI